MRLAKLVKKIPQLQVIIMGLVGGFTSIGYILLLLFLVMYLFAIAGIYAFREVRQGVTRSEAQRRAKRRGYVSLSLLAILSTLF